MHKIKYRYSHPGLRLRRTKLDVPGWAGTPEPRKNGSHEHPWHCIPFAEGAQYGIELFYPFEQELRVSTREGRIVIEGQTGPDPETGAYSPPFRNFGDQYYTYQILLDLKVEEGFAIRTEPHPRFYTDTTDTVPIAVPALLRNWWPMMFFMVFKAPSEGRTHVFRSGEPFAQVIVIPEDSDFQLVAMSEEEAAERELQARRIHKARSTLSAPSQWTSTTNTVFDGTYRQIHRAAKEKSRRK